MKQKGKTSLVYDDIIGHLVKSIMRAQLEILRRADNNDPSTVHDKYINQHFAWLTRKISGGESRHLFFPEPGNKNQYSLRIDLEEKEIDPEIRAKISERLDARDSPVLDVDNDNDEGWNYVRVCPPRERDEGKPAPTRISCLIKKAHETAINALPKGGKGFLLTSPLAIALDFLTDPEAPGTRAYALFSVRNFLFAEFGTVPDLGGERGGGNAFTIEGVDHAMQTIATSMNERPDSSGMDPVPPYGRNPEDKVVRAYLAAKKLVFLRFGDKKECEKYLEATHFPAKKKKKKKKEEKTEYNYEYQKSSYVARLPESSEIINELFGLLLPVRGADTIFRGGLRFPARRGLVMAIHGGAGAGKTSLALGLCAALRPMGITTLYCTAEEKTEDLYGRLGSLMCDRVKRLHFFPDPPHKEGSFPFIVQEISLAGGNQSGSRRPDVLDALIKDMERLAEQLDEKIGRLSVQHEKTEEEKNYFPIPKPCSLVVVLDGLHDLFSSLGDGMDGQAFEQRQIARLQQLIDTFKKMKALVLLTAGEKWLGDARLDYLVDVSVRLSHESISEYGAKPDRRMQLLKARHQLCAPGVHGMQIAGAKGLRFSPQINYRLDERSTWKNRLPDRNSIKKIFMVRANLNEVLADRSKKKEKFEGIFGDNIDGDGAVKIFRGSHIFINGNGSGGKAGLALKMALAPSFSRKRDEDKGDGDEYEYIPVKEKVLIVSFLYPKEYYDDLSEKIRRIMLHYEYKKIKDIIGGDITVFHLYPGYLKPNDLFNRIEWELQAAELYGDPYTCVIIDGIHNVFLQFPAIEEYSLFWPQLYSSLRTRPITTITTHTTLIVPSDIRNIQPVDDMRSEPLRHALVQKTDFQFEVDPCREGENGGASLKECPDGLFKVKTLACIGQPIPQGYVLWDREYLIITSRLELQPDLLEHNR